VTSTTFWCDYELARFPIDQLAKDEHGKPVHKTADGPCHHPNGNLCLEASAPRVLTHWDRLGPDEQALLLNLLKDDSIDRG